MKIYLDTSHLQKWANNELSTHEIALLNELREDVDCQFVLSFIHIREILGTFNAQKHSEQLKNKILKFANFLDGLSKSYIYNPLDLYGMEIKNSYYVDYKKLYLCKKDPFVKDFVDTLESNNSLAGDENILPARIDYRGESLKKIMNDLCNLPDHSLTTQYDDEEKINEWGRINNKPYEQCTDSNQKRKIMDNLFEKKLFELAKKYLPKIGIEELKDFIKHLLSKISLIPSNYISFYCQHALHGNISHKMKPSHIGDLNHLHALPYVDYLSCDKSNFGQLNNLIKNIKIKCGKLISSISDISIHTTK